jgi:hypothetical protein
MGINLPPRHLIFTVHKSGKTNDTYYDAVAWLTFRENDNAIKNGVIANNSIPAYASYHLSYEY